MTPIIVWTLLWVCRPKDHFFSPDSVAKGVLLAKIPSTRVYCSSEVLRQAYICYDPPPPPPPPLKIGVLGAKLSFSSTHTRTCNVKRDMLIIYISLLSTMYNGMLQLQYMKIHVELVPPSGVQPRDVIALFNITRYFIRHICGTV